jgi:hypothetical protein
MGIEKQELISELKIFKIALDEEVNALGSRLISIEAKLDKLLKQQHEAVLWETKGKDQKVKNTMVEDCPEEGWGLTEDS